MLNIIIFSKDRACQLELLLRSLKLFLNNWNSFHISVIYTYSSPEYEQSYDLLKKDYNKFNYICENEINKTFHSLVLENINTEYSYTMFLVDDIVFRNTISLEDSTFQIFARDPEILCLSLRLSPQISYCYSTDTPSPPPSFLTNLEWYWQDAPKNTDWHYPMSLDGHIFRTAEIYSLLLDLDFSNPNTLESSLTERRLDMPKMICFSQSKIVNIPANKVQDTYANRSANLVAIGELNQRFLSGDRLCLTPILDAPYTSVHQEIPFEFLSYATNNFNEPLVSVVINSNSGDRVALVRQLDTLLVSAKNVNMEVILACHSDQEETLDFFQMISNVYKNVKIEITTDLNLFLQSYSLIHNTDSRSPIVLNGDQLISNTFLEDYFAYIHKENLPNLREEDFYFLQTIKAEKKYLSLQIQQLESQLAFQFNYTYPQLYQARSDLHETQNQLNQTYEQLQKSYAQIHQLNSELEQAHLQANQTQIELQETQSRLQISQTQLQQAQSELQISQTQLKQAQSELQITQAQLQQTQSQLYIANEEIEAMKSSKFWKLRNKWFKLKKCLGLEKGDNGQHQPNLATVPEESDLSSAPELKTNEDIPEIIIETIEQELWSQDKPLVSVIIPCFNYGQYLEEAIQSVLHQTLQNLEIIVVNDGSTDIPTIEILENLNFPKTTLIHQDNQKLPNARNNGINKAKGKYICCLDADDLLKPTYLEKCVAKMEAENLDICYSWLQEFGESDVVRPSLEFNLEELLQYNGVIVSAVFKRNIWQKVGGYNAQMIEGYEDWDFWIRLATVGGLGGVIQEPLFLYRKHGHSMFNEALDNHSSLYAQIQTNHRGLYENQTLVKQIVRSRKQYIVNQPYLNLLSSYSQGAFAHISSGNILFALPCLVTGGSEKVLLNLVKMLKQEGFNITIFTSVQTPLSMGDNTSKFLAFTEEIYPLYSLFNSSQWESFIYYLIESRQINLVFLSGSSYFYDILPQVKQRFPHVKVIDQQYNEVGHMDNNRRYAEYIDMNIVENETVKDFLLVKSQEKTEKVILIPNGVDTEYFDPSVELQKTINLSDDLVKNKFIVTFLGRFSIEKAPHLFVEIVNRLKEDANFYFIMAGNGILYDEVFKSICDYGLTDKIYLPSFVDARECLKLSNVLVLPSTIDGRPNAVLEGLSMGVPVIASAVGGLPDLVKDGYNGYLCEPGDVEKFVEHIQILSQDATLYAQMRKNARAYAETHLNLVAQTKQKYLTVFEKLLGSI